MLMLIIFTSVIRIRRGSKMTCFRTRQVELRYTLDPKEVHGEDFPGETFRVVKEKEVRQFGEYRTPRLVLEAWDGQG